jgi:cysteine/O-acetylserine efflux protein
LFIITSKNGDSVTNFYPFLIYVMVTTFTPGPNNIMAMTNAMRDGYRRTLNFLLGVFAGFLVVMLVCGLLNVILVSLLPQMQLWLNILGVAYLVYLAVHTILSKPVAGRPTENLPLKTDLNTFKAGVLMQFLNLKLILYGITVYAMFITPVFHQPISASLFAPVLALIGLVATAGWALGGAVFRTFYQTHYRLFNFAMGGLLLYAAIHGLLSSVLS